MKLIIDDTDVAILRQCQNRSVQSVWISLPKVHCKNIEIFMEKIRSQEVLVM